MRAKKVTKKVAKKKVAAKKVAAKKRAAAAARPPRTSRPGKRPAQRSGSLGVSVRMYRLGVGDCFLVSLPRADGKTFRMLIDCGVHQSQPGGGERIDAVVRNLKAETGGRIDVLVTTHEHWDHLSGFSQAADLFATFSVGEVWAAWTENARDAFAKTLKDKRARALKALAQAESRFRLAGREGAQNALSGLLGFFGDTTGAKLKVAGEVLKQLAGGESKVKYREPGEPPIELEGLDARIFVLGPPRDRDAIHRAAPRKGENEVYAFGAYDQALTAVELAFENQQNAPFDSRFVIPLAGTKSLGFFQQHYWADRGGDPGDRVDTTQDWRRIDDDWLGAATSLGLKLDEDTNNTSLVIALELGPVATGGPVILFAADAQVGNWLSWQKVRWKDVGGREVTGPDLLRRTILYKVGHHASHNATLSTLGLELMDALELAFVPTDDKMAKKVGWGKLPYPKLLQRLDEKTGGRVVRTDRDLPGAAGARGVTADPLFYQVDL